MTRLATKSRLRHPARPEGLVGGLSALGEDVATLAGLQAELAAHDLRESLGKSVPAIVLTVVALLVVPASVVVALYAAGLALAAGLNWAPHWGLLAVAGLALLICAVGMVFALRNYRSGFTTFRRSADELTRNLAWAKTVMTQSGR